MLTLKTPEGTLVIEIEDPDVEVSVDGSEVVLNGITKHELRLKPGNYQYRATRNGEPAESDWVTIERDGRTVVRIRQLPLAPSTATPATEDAPSNVSLSDIDFEPYTQSMRARQVWVHARFFERKNQLELAALCCTEIRRLYPRSEFVERANAKLAQLEKQGQPIPNAPHIDPASEFWRQAQSFERQGRLDLAIALCSQIMMTYSDSKYAEIAEQKYEALEDTGPGAASLAELFWTQTLVYDEEGQPKLAEEMRTAVVKDFPRSLYADVIRKRLNSTEAGRLWTAVLAFEANVPQAVVVCCSEIVKKFLQSSHASSARAKIELWSKSGLPSLEGVGDAGKFLWELALRYRQSGDVETAMLLCSQVPILFPDSSYVSRARGLLADLRQFSSDPPPEIRLEVPLEPDGVSEMDSADPLIQTISARRMWALVPLFERKEQLEAVTVYCAEIARRFPDSEFAKPAAEKLAELEQQGYFGFVPFSTADFRLWYLAVSNEEKGRQDIAIMLCHELLMSYSDSRCAARAQKKYDELKGSPKGAEGLAEVFMAYSLSFLADGNANLARKMRQKIVTEFPTTTIAEVLRRQLARNATSDPTDAEIGVGVRVIIPAMGPAPLAFDFASGSTLAEGSVANRNAVDGIVLHQTHRVRRLVPDQLVPVWFGKWYFKEIPEQLYGQNFAFVSREGGDFGFEVTAVNGRNLSHRIWRIMTRQRSL